MRKNKILLFAILASSLLLSCQEDQNGLDAEITKPTVTFSEDDLVYEVKVNQTITIEPTLTDVTDGYYAWSYNGEIISRESTLEFSSAQVGQHYLTFTLDAANGSVERGIRVDVLEVTPPEVVLPITDGVVRATSGRDTEIIPSLKYCDDQTTYAWYINGEEAGTTESIWVNMDEINDHTLRLDVTNSDGFTRAEATLRICEVPNLSFIFNQEVYYVAQGGSIVLGPYVSYSDDATTYSWDVDGTPQASTSKFLTFTPDAIGEYQINISGSSSENSTSASTKVICVAAEDHRRAITSESSNDVTIFEFTAAPGQFVNGGSSTTPQEAIEYAQGNVNSGSYVSLGAWGGYMIAGFDHSVLNVEGSRDFWIKGNAFATSNEPAIVWVMQDVNGDGEPNDVWYELKGSETGLDTTEQDYVITYYKPESGEYARWTDNSGNMDTVGASTCFPGWITAESYTIVGTKIQSRNVDESDGSSEYWNNAAFDWGYVDNYGSDYLNAGTEFEIDNAINRDGTPVVLEYIDFVKVQTAVNAKSGWLGEISPEILGFMNLNL